MEKKTKLKLKKFSFHPITTFMLLTFGVIILSGILSLMNFQTTYTVIKSQTLELETKIASVKNLLNYEGIKHAFGSSATNFASFAPLISLLMTSIGLSIAHASGLIETYIKRVTFRVNNKTITFLLILLAIASSIVNDVGYVVLIPLAALLYIANGRSPLLGIVAAYCGVAFGYGASLFVGSMEVALTAQTELASRLIDPEFHVGLASNLFIIIAFSMVITVVGTIIIEKIIVKRLGKYRISLEETQEILRSDIILEEQKQIELEINEKRGLRHAYIVAILFIMFFIYSLIPGLPLSGLLLDMNEATYVNQAFGENSYFQDGFTYMVTLFFMLTGIAYGFGAKTIKSDKQLVEKSSEYVKNVGSLLALLFFASQFIAAFKESNIGVVITAFGANLIKDLSFTGVPLILLSIFIIALSNIFLTSPSGKWAILSPVIVPLMMQSNISPAFSQFILRAGDSITKGVTPFLAYFVIYLGYLNIYNKEKEPITIRGAIGYLIPFFLIIGATWILLALGWYLIGLPIGPAIFPTL